MSEEEKDLFAILDRLPVEVSSLVPEPYYQRQRAACGLDSLAPARDRVDRIAAFLGHTGWNRVALHLPWDAADEESAASLADHLSRSGLEAGSVSVELPQPLPVDGADPVFGSLAAADESVRESAYRRLESSLDLMRTLGSKAMVLWIPDSWDTPGQASFFETALRLEENLMRLYARMAHDEALLLKCGTPLPARYLTAVFSPGRAREICGKLGHNAKVLLNAPAPVEDVSLEQTIAFLLRSDTFGGLHYSGLPCQRAALHGGQFDPWGSFRAALTMLEAEHLNYAPLPSLLFLLDRVNDAPDPFPELDHAVTGLSVAFLRAGQVDLFALAQARTQPWSGEADRLVHDAFLGQVSNLWDTYRQDRGADTAPTAPPPGPTAPPPGPDAAPPATEATPPEGGIPA